MVSIERRRERRACMRAWMLSRARSRECGRPAGIPVFRVSSPAFSSTVPIFRRSILARRGCKRNGFNRLIRTVNLNRANETSPGRGARGSARDSRRRARAPPPARPRLRSWPCPCLGSRGTAHKERRGHSTHPHPHPYSADCCHPHTPQPQLRNHTISTLAIHVRCCSSVTR